MAFGNDRAPLGAGHRAQAAINEAPALEQPRRAIRRRARAAAVSFLSTRAASASSCEDRGTTRGMSGIPTSRRWTFQPLHIDRDFERDWSSWRRQRLTNGREQRFHRRRWLPNAQVRFADRFQHIRLPRHIVDRGAIAIDKLAIDLGRDMQHRRARGQRFDL